MLRDPFFNLRSQMRDLERLRREMNQTFAGLPSFMQSAPTYPAMNVWTHEDGAVVTAELPGCDPEQLDIAVVGDTLRLAGRRSEASCEGPTYHRRERPCGAFERAFQLPFAIEASKVAATFDKGVLFIELPRAEADKPKKITIKAA